MLPPEARWFGRQLARRSFEELSPLLNLGSQSLAFRTKVQPWLERELFAPARRRGIVVVHSDLLPEEGVDLVGDLTEPAFLDELRQRRFRSVVCSNLLEHVEQPERIAAATSAAVMPGGLLFASVPFRFPYHADPIDTLFRPSPTELAALFPNTTVEAAEVISGGNLTTYALGRLIGNPRRLLADLAQRRTVPPRPAVVSPADRRPTSRGHWLPWLLRGFKISCVVLRKEAP